MSAPHFSRLPFFSPAQLQGDWLHTVGQQGDQPGQLDCPRGLALTPDEEFLLVADEGNRRVAVLRALDGAWVRQLTGPPGTLEGPVGVAVVPSTGEVLVSDWDRRLSFLPRRWHFGRYTGHGSRQRPHEIPTSIWFGGARRFKLSLGMFCCLLSCFG